MSMYKLFLYFTLVIVYLGLAKLLSPSELGVHYLQNEKSFGKLVKPNNSTVILIDTHATGFLIKTYYQKYRVISGYDSVDEFIVRTSKEFARRNLDNIGMSLYRRTETKEETIPLPPGSLYLNNREFGDWRTEKNGKSIWFFKKAFKNFPNYLGWEDFRPSLEFYQEMKSHQGMGKPYYGQNNEFGTNGKITREAFPHFFREERMKKVEMKTLLFEYFKENF